MAVFGVPVVREDDALRAVRAASSCANGVPALETELGSGARLEVRIGINTGEVVAGDPAAGHGFVTGEPVARGQAAPAERGRGRSPARRGDARPGRACGRGGTARAAGSSRASATRSAAFRLESVDSEATALPRRDDAPLVGREPSWSGFVPSIAAGRGGGGARLVTILGEPGIGKSRLAREFVAGLADEATVLVGRCPPYGEGITFWPLRELLRQAGRDEGVRDRQQPRDLRRREAACSRSWPPSGRSWLVFDDVHWAEPTFLDFVEYLAAPARRRARSSWSASRDPSSPSSGRPGCRRRRRRSCSSRSRKPTRRMLLEALGAAGSSPHRIAEAAEGNPLFVEQLAAIADEYSAPRDAGSIRGVLHERLDRLEREERSVLERAAVVGRSFSLEAVLDLTPAGRARRRTGATARARPQAVHPARHDRAGRRLSLPPRADPRRRLRRHPQGHARRAPRAHGRPARDAGRRDALIGYHLEQAFRLRRELGTLDPELGARAGPPAPCCGRNERSAAATCPRRSPSRAGAGVAPGRRRGAPGAPDGVGLRPAQVRRLRRCRDRPRRGGRCGRPAPGQSCRAPRRGRAPVRPLSVAEGTTGTRTSDSRAR